MTLVRGKLREQPLLDPPLREPAPDWMRISRSDTEAMLRYFRLWTTESTADYLLYGRELGVHLDGLGGRIEGLRDTVRKELSHGLKFSEGLQLSAICHRAKVLGADPTPLRGGEARMRMEVEDSRRKSFRDGVFVQGYAFGVVQCLYHMRGAGLKAEIAPGDQRLMDAAVQDYRTSNYGMGIRDIYTSMIGLGIQPHPTSEDMRIFQKMLEDDRTNASEADFLGRHIALDHYLLMKLRQDGKNLQQPMPPLRKFGGSR